MKKWSSLLAAGVGVMSLATGLVFTGGVGVAGATGGPTVTATPDIVGLSAASSPTGASITIKYSNELLNPNYVPADGLAITECNPNVLGADPAACNQNPANLGLPGGPYIVKAGKKGKGKATIAVVSGAVGDGVCSAGGLCYIVLADPVTSAEIGIVAFGINPLA